MRTTFSSVHLSKGNFIFVPYLDFTRPWTDKDLYDLYDLSDDERKLIEKTIRKIDLSE